MNATETMATQEARIASAASAGRVELARGLATNLRETAPTSDVGWRWGARLSPDPVEALVLAREAHRLAPSAQTSALLEQARARVHALATADGSPPPLAPTAPVPQPAGWRAHQRVPLLLLLLLLSIVLLLAGQLYLSQAEPAVTGAPPAPSTAAGALNVEAGSRWVAGERDEAIALWQEAHALAPDQPDLATSLAQAHVARSTDHLKDGAPDLALPHLEAAYALRPEEMGVVHEYQALRAYIAGRDALASGDWALALETLSPLYGIDPNYLNVSQLIEGALAAQQQAAVMEASRHAARAGDARYPSLGRALRASLAPATVADLPAAASLPPLDPLRMNQEKHIVVSINAQRMYVYEGNRLIWNWVASTGEPGRPTVPGRYHIQSKFENARSNVWSLWMPYWQGIYWAGPVENGIHGQVTFDAGGRLWEGYLGTRITYGCVMIADHHAAQLFEWTEMGTPVSIHWDWDPTWVPNANGERG